MGIFSFQLTDKDSDIEEEVQEMRRELEQEASKKDSGLASVGFDDASPSMTDFKEVSLDVAKGNNEYSSVEDYMETATKDLDSILP